MIDDSTTLCANKKRKVLGERRLRSVFEVKRFKERNEPPIVESRLSCLATPPYAPFENGKKFLKPEMTTAKQIETLF